MGPPNLEKKIFLAVLIICEHGSHVENATPILCTKFQSPYALRLQIKFHIYRLREKQVFNLDISMTLGPGREMALTLINRILSLVVSSANFQVSGCNGFQNIHCFSLKPLLPKLTLP